MSLNEMLAGCDQIGRASPAGGDGVLREADGDSRQTPVKGRGGLCLRKDLEWMNNSFADIFKAVYLMESN